MFPGRCICALFSALLGTAALCAEQQGDAGKVAEAVVRARELLQGGWSGDLRWQGTLPQVDAHLARIPDARAVDFQDLFLSGGLQPVDAEILSIALYRHRSPEFFEGVRKALATLFANQAMPVPDPVQPPAGLLTASHRLAWEYLLLRPDGSRRLEATAITAATALGEIGDRRSLAVLEAFYLWTVKNPRHRGERSSVVKTLATFGGDTATKREALATAWRCYDGTPDAEEKQARLGQIKARCDLEVVKEELGQNNRYEKFLKSLLDKKKVEAK